MKQYKRIMGVVLAAALIMETPIPVSASETNTSKEEVVYINLNQDGSVNEIYVVNIFDMDEQGQIIDYGNYETLRNMTTTDEITYSDDTVRIDASAGKLYYEGKSTVNIMPWDISIHYYMDGAEYTAEEIAGKSGALKIAISIRKNTECNSAFFEGYALQTTVVLDTENCRNIHAENATVANVGRYKQITYTILPDTETDIEICADVKDFEMDGISINGVRMNLDISVEGDELYDKVDEIIQAVNEVDDGAGSIYEGTDDLYKGSGELYDGTTELSSGAGTLAAGADALYTATNTLNGKVSELHAGVKSLSAGADSLYSGLNTLTGKNAELLSGARSAYEALCTAAQTQLNAELAARGMEPVTLTPDTYDAVLTELLNRLDAEEVYKQAYNAVLQEVTAQVEAEAETLYANVATQLVYEQLVLQGYTDEEAKAYLQTEEGQMLISQTVAAMTEEEKAEIRNAYIEQVMASEEVTQQIAAIVAQADAAAAAITEIKGQLDSYGIFYRGLQAYTLGVAEAATGANALQSGLHTLQSNTEVLKTSVGELDHAVGELSEGADRLNTGIAELDEGAGKLYDGAKELTDGAKELKEGTEEFADRTSGMNDEIHDEIDSMKSSITGNTAETISFASEKNTNIKSVQFVIKTDAVKIEKPETIEVEEEEQLNFLQKLLRLFGF